MFDPKSGDYYYYLERDDCGYNAKGKNNITLLLGIATRIIMKVKD